VRISQLRKEDAQQLLRQSLELWKDLDIEDPDMPDFATRISLSRLLMEAELEDEAIEVLERLIREDDMSVEAWYLGGWCLHLLAQKEKAKPAVANGDGAGHDEEEELLRRSRSWLVKSLDLFQKLDYEDEPLHEHAMELVKELNDVLGEPVEEENGADSGDEGWEDEGSDEDEDEEMIGG
jgi:tetratricopeptide (TPR) repeat protein